MSLDVSLYSTAKTIHRCSECDDTHTCKQRVEMFTWNITHNLGEMADKAGIYKALWRPEEININEAGKLIDILTTGLMTLKSAPEHFKQFNPRNGWGNYEGLVECIEKYLEACIKYPEAEVYVSR